jgi:hypothetical protein
LNTDSAEFVSDDFNVIHSHTEAVAGRRMTWSESIAHCLSLAPTDVILYLQEDYFINAPVHSDLIQELALRMQDERLGCIALTQRGAQRFKHAPEFPGLLSVPPGSRYRVNCQAALWRVDFLERFLRSDENAWQFEIFGTRRSTGTPYGFYTLDPVQGVGEAVPYIFGTGVVKGRWNPQIPALFKEHSIEMDYSKRGFYQGVGYAQNKWNTFKKLFTSPNKFLRGMLGL